MEKSDVLYYAGWGLSIAAGGVFAVIWSLNLLNFIGAFMFWLLAVGIILLGLGLVKTREAPKDSGMLIGSGVLLVIVSASLCSVVLGIIPFSTAVAVIIIFAGLGIVGYALLSRKERSV